MFHQVWKCFEKAKTALFIQEETRLAINTLGPSRRKTFAKVTCSGTQYLTRSIQQLLIAAM